LSGIATPNERRDCHVALALAASAVLVAIVPLPGEVRLPVLAAFLLVAPGLALTAAPDVRRLGLVVVFAVSLAVDVVISEAVMYAGLWSGTRAVVAVAAVTTVVATYRLHASRRPRVSP
jgi:hypothetical protein